jgi:hypothetical protein
MPHPDLGPRRNQADVAVLASELGARLSLRRVSAAFTHADLARCIAATARLERHDLPGAAGAVRDVLDATKTRRTDSVVRRISRLTRRLDELAATGEPQARELVEEVHAALDTTNPMDPVVQELVR